MRQQVVDILSEARRRMLAVQAKEAVVFALTAAALSSAMLEIAHALAYFHPRWAGTLCGFVSVCGLAMLLAPRLGRAMHVKLALARLAGTMLVLIGAAGLAATISSYWLQVPRFVLPLALLPAMGLAAAVFVYVRPPSLREVAVILDLRLGLRERLSTAIELIEGRQARKGEAGLSEVIFAQAVGAARKADAQRAQFASRGPAAAGALGLSVLLALTLLALPGNDFVTSPDEIVAAFDAMSPQQKLTLADELAKAAKSAPDEQTRQDLHAAEQAAGRDDPRAFKEAVDRLTRAIESGLVKIVKVPGVATPGERIADVTGNSASPSVNPAASNSPFTTAANQAPPQPQAPMQVVFNPKYATLAASQAGDGGAHSGTYVSFDAAWEQAVSQANQSLRDGQVPPRYQQLVHDFFLASRE